MKIPGALDPFVSVFKGFAELGTSLFPTLPKGDKSSKKPTKLAVFNDSANKKDAEGKAKKIAYVMYKNYKKGNKMLTHW
jgi:hypothetical protein